MVKKVESKVRPSYLAEVMGVTAVYLRHDVFSRRQDNETNRLRIEYVERLNEAIEQITKAYGDKIKRQKPSKIGKKN